MYAAGILATLESSVLALENLRLVAANEPTGWVGLLFGAMAVAFSSLFISSVLKRRCICRHKTKEGRSGASMPPPADTNIDPAAAKKCIDVVEHDVSALDDRLDAMPAHEFRAEEVARLKEAIERHCDAIAGLKSGA